MSKRPLPPGPESHRRFSLPFEKSIHGKAYVHYAAVLDRCAIIAPGGEVQIGAARLEQCVIVEPCVIEDDVVAVAAILQGQIGRGTRIEAHADIQGRVGERCTIGRGVLVRPGAIVDDEAEIGDLTILHEMVEVGWRARIGPQSDIGEQAVVGQEARLPARSIVRPESYAIVPADERQAKRADDREWVNVVIADDEDHPDHIEGPVETEVEEDEDHGFDGTFDGYTSDDHGPMDWAALAPAEFSARPGEMAKGRPKLTIGDFRPGTARSWALSKLGRIANLHSKDGRLTKALVQRFRPDLLELPITKEVLRISPPVTDHQLAEMSMEAVSPARYDVWTGITFHSGENRSWQMLGPKTNDVFVLSVPESVLSELEKRLARGSWTWTKSPGGDHSLNYSTEGVSVYYADIRRNRDGYFQVSRWRTLMEGDEESKGQIYRDAVGAGEFADLDDAREKAEQVARAELRHDISALRKLAFERQEWHPDRLVRHPVGWVRTLIYPRQTVLVVEIQSDRPWMGFRYEPKDQGLVGVFGKLLREIYFESFASDALNVVIEWAFVNRYGEVLVLDHESRKKLGGQPPKSFYDAVPKKYVIGELEPLLTPMTYIRTYNWVPRDLKARRIVPNSGGDQEIRALIERVGFPLIRRILVRRHVLKQCGYISQAFVDALAREGIQGHVADSGAHAVAVVRLPSGRTWDVDLSYAQFLCDIDDDDEVAAMIDKIDQDPWVTVRYERAD